MYEFLMWLAALITSMFGVSNVAPPQQDYIGVVAAEAAYSAMLPGSAPVKPKKPIDPNCKTCKGKGKVPSGDGLGWSPCPICQSEDITATLTTSGTVAPQMRIQKPNNPPTQIR